MLKKITFGLSLFLIFTVSFAQTPLTTAVDFTVTDIHGDTHNLFSYLNSGKYVVIDFFFTTCPPCIASVPTLNDSYTKYGCNQGDVFFLSIDQGDTDAQVSQYETDYGSLIPAASGVDGGGNAVVSAYGITAYPTVILIAPDQTIVEQDMFPVTMTLLDAAFSNTGAINPQPCAAQPFDDAAIGSIIGPVGNLCGGAISPQFPLTNFGTSPLTEVTITYSLNGGAPQTFIWTGSLDSALTEIITLPVMVAPAGSQTLTITVSNPNGNTDANSGNNSQQISFTVLNNAGLTSPMFEGFESGAFPPASWSIENPDNANSWAEAQVGKSGLYSVFMDNFNYNANGEADDLVIPGFDLSSFASPALSFDLAYTSFDLTVTDTLQILISTDCGNTFSVIRELFGADLRTVSPVQSPYIPASSDWRRESVDLSAWASESYVEVRFRNLTAYENNLYLDNINLAGSGTSIEDDLLVNALSLFPNPASDAVTIQYQAEAKGQLEVGLTDLSGRLLETYSYQVIPGMNRFHFNTDGLPTGLYFVGIQSGDARASVKLMVE